MLCFHYKYQSVNVYNEVRTMYCKNHTRHIQIGSDSEYQV